MQGEDAKFPSMTITFVLPGSSRTPVYDYRVVFEYANHLSFRGHNVVVVHAAQVGDAGSLSKRAYDAARFTLWKATDEFGPQRWFRLWPAVKLLWIPTTEEKHIPPADVIVATDWATAEAVATYGEDKGHKFYLVQHYEPWRAPDERVQKSWKLPLQKIASARWLKELAVEMGESAAYIPNGLDFDVFGCDVPVRQRTRPSVLMMYHESVTKGSEDGIKAMRAARAVFPELEATLFGICPRPDGLLPWMKYVRQPTQQKLRDLYNHATVFLAPSWVEGWPLPPGEAMCCGAALACTDIPGHNEYAVQDRNALMVEPHHPQQLSEALVRLLREKSLRFPLAEQALSDIRRFSWDDAINRVETEFGWRVAGRVVKF